MHCPFCAFADTRVVDSRLADEGGTVRRRRECPQCGQRFTTFERAELSLPMVVKTDGRREAFNEDKLQRGLTRALSKRPVATEQVDAALRQIQRRLREKGDREVPARLIGELVMEALRGLDPVAYVRFASVYRRFEDVDAFSAEIARLKEVQPSNTEEGASGAD
ncbi:transcriptional regulator NrdR [Acidithiobacillus montserratensis]|uniref:Transcriptional regulator NrdR n=1 Tax=Acidithiobacillus montserratensis TaxID=2729135 RepID=A0ACD5HER1_9PROT|nr:transcriptional repressor NrdR [Acidithiobacillaceae bacterium]MBU2748943.1 transcriptional repressor NrdR [Acidithiobacillus montserratensis]